VASFVDQYGFLATWLSCIMLSISCIFVWAK